jgi:virulence factor Mce-like protein
MRGKGAQSPLASPVLVGAITVLVTVIAIFLAYNANQGLPFVPTYRLDAELESGANLVAGNEVRVGGYRVGTVTEINPKVVERRAGAKREIAVIGLELDKRLEELPADTHVRIRPRSAFGLKYVELTPGRSERTLEPGGTLRLGQSSAALELEDLYSTFEAPVRSDLRAATTGLGDAVAGRGPDLNRALGELDPFLAHLRPVAARLADPETDLDGFVRQLAVFFGQLAPVADDAAELAGLGADTFAAINREPVALRGAIERLPGTFGDGAASLRATRPLLTDLTGLANDLEPSARVLPATLPPLARALAKGTPVLERTPALGGQLEDTFGALQRLVDEPSTLLSLLNLRTALAALRPAIEHIAPYQTVCNFTMYFLTPLGEHQSKPGGGGTVQVQQIKQPSLLQPNSVTTSFNSRPWDLPPGVAPHGAEIGGQPAGRVVGPPYQPAVDSRGRADCQNGQIGYPNGRLVEPFFRELDAIGTLPDGTPKGGNAAVAISNYQGLSGGTYRSRELGIDGLEDVP